MVRQDETTRLRLEDLDALDPALSARIRRGERLTFTDGDREVARLEPVAVPDKPHPDPEREKEIKEEMAAVQALRKEIHADWKARGIKPPTIEELIALKHEGHKY